MEDHIPNIRKCELITEAYFAIITRNGLTLQFYIYLLLVALKGNFSPQTIQSPFTNLQDWTLTDVGAGFGFRNRVTKPIILVISRSHKGSRWEHDSFPPFYCYSKCQELNECTVTHAADPSCIPNLLAAGQHKGTSRYIHDPTSRSTISHCCGGCR